MTSTFDLKSALSAISNDHDSFDLRVREIPCPSVEGSVRVNCKMYYLTFRDGLPTTDEFIEYLKWRLVPFCLPRKHREEVAAKAKVAKNEIERERLYTEQRNKAVGLFIKAQKQKSKKLKAGEPGEIILYILLEWALKAPQIISKMYLKTSAQMPVHGSDGIHASWDGKQLTFYFGESKLFEKLPSGISAAFKSIKEFQDSKEKQTREIDIIRDHMDLGNDMAELQEELVKYLDPYDTSGNQQNHRQVFACFVGYDFEKYTEILKLKPEDAETEFIKVATNRASEAVALIGKGLKANKMDTINFEFFFIPFQSVDQFRKDFFKSTGITK